MKLRTTMLAMAMIAAVIVAGSGTVSAGSGEVGTIESSDWCALDPTWISGQFICYGSPDDCYLAVWLYQSDGGQKLYETRVLCEAFA